jgi:hypothetical protein
MVLAQFSDGLANYWYLTSPALLSQALLRKLWAIAIGKLYNPDVPPIDTFAP